MDLYECIYRGDDHGVLQLLASGANPNHVFEDGSRLLHHAAYLGNVDCMQALLTDPTTEVDPLNVDGNTPLHVACACRRSAAVKMLLRAGERVHSVHVPNNKGKLPIDYVKKAKDAASREIYGYLLEYEQKIRDVYSLPSDTDVLRKYILDLLLDVDEFRDRCKDTIYHLVQVKQSALRTASPETPELESPEDTLPPRSAIPAPVEGRPASAGAAEYDAAPPPPPRPPRPASFNLGTLSGSKGAAAAEPPPAALPPPIQKTTSDGAAAPPPRPVRAPPPVPAVPTGGLPPPSVPPVPHGGFPPPSMPTTTPLPPPQLPRPTTVPVPPSPTKAGTVSPVTSRPRTVGPPPAMVGVAHAAPAGMLVPIGGDVHRMPALIASSALSEDQRGEPVQSPEKIEQLDHADEAAGLAVFTHDEGGRKVLKGATREKLLERLLRFGTSYDMDFVQAFFLGHRAFISMMELLRVLLAAHEQARSAPSRARVVALLCYWIEHNGQDIVGDADVLKALESFVHDKLTKYPDEKHILDGHLLKAKNRAQHASVAPTLVGADRPEPIKPNLEGKEIRSKAADLKHAGPVDIGTMRMSRPGRANSLLGSLASDSSLSFGQYVSVLDISPVELARQITIYEHRLLSNIQAKEFMDQAWLGPDKEKLAPNIAKITDWSTRMSHWAATEILSGETPKARAAIYEHIVAIIKALEALQNFNGVVELLTGLQSSQIFRLRFTLQNVSVKVRRQVDELMKETSTDLNYKRLRARIASSKRPLIPFPGMYLRDIVFLDQGMPTFLDSDRTMLNFQKLQKKASYIREFLSFKEVGYALAPLPEVLDYLQKTYVEMNDDERYSMSLQCEPRSSGRSNSSASSR